MEDPSEWRLMTPGGIRHRLVSQHGSFQEEDATWIMTIIIQASDLANFITEAFPTPTFGTSIFYPRRFYPYGLPALRAKRVSVKGNTDGRPIDPFSADAQAPSGTYEPFLKVTIEFTTCPENDQPEADNPFTFLDIRAQASGEYLTSEVSGDHVRWQDEEGDTESPTEQDTPLEQKVPSVEIEWSCKWKQIPFDWFRDTLIPRMRSLIGKVNNANMVLFHNAPPETILFDSWSMTYQYTWREGYPGKSPVSLDMKFIEKNFEGEYNPIEPEIDSDEMSEYSGSESSQSESSQSETFTVQVTHNHIWRPNCGWQRLLINGNPIYQQADLASLFEP